jgi:hypothetical protein
MTTLSVMKQRIADEVARSDLTSMIAYAISDAISYYQSKRFLFNESRDIEFDTASDQEFYDKYDNAAIPNLMKIDYVKLDLDGWAYTLCRADPEELEDYSAASGQPTSYTYYDRQIRLYPVPDQAWTIRIAGHLKLDEPASDTEKHNAWMVEAERLIRARAKLNLARNVNAAGLTPTFADKAIAIYSAEERDAFDEMKMRTNAIHATGRVKGYE